MAILKWLRGLGPIGGHIADGLALLLNNWLLTMSAILSLWAALTDFVVAIAENPRVHTAILIFLTVFWTSIGVVYLFDRRKPRVIKPEHDYRYGLTFEGIVPLYDPNNEDGALQFSLQFRNFSSGPIRYTVESFDIRIDTRSLPKLKKGALTSFLPRGGARNSSQLPFKKSAIQEFIGKTTEGTVDFEVSYGHPELPPVRFLKMSLRIVLVMAENPHPSLGFNAIILEESDEPFYEASQR